MPVVAGWAPATPPGRFAQIPAAHNPCIFTNASERRVAITRKYAGIRVLAHHDFQFWRFSNLLTFLLLLFFC